MLIIIIVSKITYCEYKYSSWFALLADYSMSRLIIDNSLTPTYIRKKEIINKDYWIKNKYYAWKIYTNFFPIKDVLGSSFTLILYPKYLLVFLAPSNIFFISKQK